jgi:hypothetical protein
MIEVPVNYRNFACQLLKSSYEGCTVIPSVFGYGLYLELEAGVRLFYAVRRAHDGGMTSRSSNTGDRPKYVTSCSIKKKILS